MPSSRPVNPSFSVCCCFNGDLVYIASDDSREAGAHLVDVRIDLRAFGTYGSINVAHVIAFPGKQLYDFV